MTRSVVNKFNRGEVDQLLIAREDVSKVNDSADLMENFMPLRTGPMQYRPGFGNLGAASSGSMMIPFVRSISDKAIIELTDSLMYVWVDDARLQVNGVTSTVLNSDFSTNINNWTDASGTDSVATWGSSAAKLTGTGTTSAVLYQTITNTDHGEEHTLRIVVKRAPVYVELGTSGVRSDDIYSGWLGVGDHMLTFDADASNDTTISLSNNKEYSCLVDQVAFLGPGDFGLVTDITNPWGVKYDQSGDVIYIAQADGPQYKIERRATKSWSIVKYRSTGGPFGLINNSEVTLTPSGLTGDITLTASSAYFKSGHVGALYKLVSQGQKVVDTFSGTSANQTNSILVTGVEGSRIFTIKVVVGTWSSGTVVLERSVDDANWESVKTYTSGSAVNEDYDDDLDNAEVYYRLTTTGLAGGDSITVKMIYSGGSMTGIARAFSRTSDTVMRAQVLQPFGATEATRDWYESDWCTYNGYPTSVALYEGRLFWAGKNKYYGSVSDVYDSFDLDREGDDRAIVKTIGFGPVEDVLWLARSNRLMMGLASDIIPVRSSSFGEALTQNNANIRETSTQGAADVQPVRMDNTLYFAQRSNRKLYSIDYSWGTDQYDTVDCNLMNKTLFGSNIKRMAVTMQPETRVWVLTTAGFLKVYLIDDSEDVKGWCQVDPFSGATFEDIIVLPGTKEDRVYVRMERADAFSTTLEKLALFSEAEGDTESYHYDGWVEYDSPGATLSGLSHLEGFEVYAWADGAEIGPYTVSSGQINIGSSSYTKVIVGTRYTAKWKSTKPQGYLPYGQTVLSEQEQITDAALILQNYVDGSLQYGPDFSTLDNMPEIEEGEAVVSGVKFNNYDMKPLEFYGDMSVDPRICLQATGPCTVVAITYNIENEFTTDSPVDLQALSKVLRGQTNENG